MDRWKYFDVTHRGHTIMNPLSEGSLDPVPGLLDLAPGARVLDLGCGKGETLIRLARRFRAAGNVSAGVALGLTPLFASAGPEEDFDLYEAMRWRAAELWAAAHPADPDARGPLRLVRGSRDRYLEWGRGTLGHGPLPLRRLTATPAERPPVRDGDTPVRPGKIRRARAEGAIADPSPTPSR
jgi:hypothetical protein